MKQEQLTEEQALAVWNEDESAPSEPVDKPEATNDEPAQPAPEEPKEDDPFEGFSPKAREYIVSQQKVIEELRANTQALGTRLRNTEGHIGGLKSQLDRAASAARQAGADAPSSQEIADAAGSPEALKQLREDYPEISKLLDLSIQHRMSSMARPEGPANETVEELRARIAQLERMRAEDYIESRHEGWVETVQSDKFRMWKATQPREVLALGDSPDPRDAVRMLDLFKNSAAKQPSAPAPASPAAAIPSGKASSRRVTKSTDEMSDEEYWKYLDSIEK